MDISTIKTTGNETGSSHFVTVSYWIVTGIFAIFMTLAAIGELTQAADIVKSLNALQIPLYYLNLLGLLKLLGVAAILIPGFRRLTEWAYAGFTFDLVGAIYALIVVQPAFISDYIAAPTALILCITSYGLYRKRAEAHE